MSELPRLLVVGAAPGSLGEAVVQETRNWELGQVFTAGISGHEDFVLDVRNTGAIKEALSETAPDYVVCTVGVNVPAQFGSGDMALALTDSFLTNVVGPLELLRLFVAGGAGSGIRRKRFAVVSSNSARIPRGGSTPYCASKAALSMGLRVAARDLASQGYGDHPWVWGYEPGLLAGTPMTRATIEAFGGAQADPILHRMKGVGGAGLDPGMLAQRIVNDLACGNGGLHGCLFPFDAGEV